LLDKYGAFFNRYKGLFLCVITGVILRRDGYLGALFSGHIATFLNNDLVLRPLFDRITYYIIFQLKAVGSAALSQGAPIL